MARPSREPRNRRPRPVRQQATTILVVCCGQTERRYLEGLKTFFPNRAVSLAFKHQPCAPTQLVDFARQYARHRDGFDEIWCVFDVDEFPDVEEAVAKAKRLKIEIAVSNLCFELWLLLHFNPVTANCRTPLQRWRSSSGTSLSTPRADSTSVPIPTVSMPRSSGPSNSTPKRLSMRRILGPACGGWFGE